MTVLETEDLWAKSTRLKDDLRSFCSVRAPLSRGNQWKTLVGIALRLANMRLESISRRLEKGDIDSAVILARSLFELEVNLSYMARDVANRLPEYLSRGRIPLTKKEAKRAAADLDLNPSFVTSSLIPKQAWRPMKEMCDVLNRTPEYETFYRYASVPTHAGAFLLGNQFVRLAGC
ncbi:MAG: hypothetical protein HY330_05605 [Chloroflexi bacterium]|nr:hypothetical protein [Chloroflexota bacterium]